MLVDDLSNEANAEARLDIKAAAIASVGTFAREKASSFDVELAEVSEVKGGVMTLVRAWRGDEPVGFGPDGSVEVERIFIYNPPILVPDFAGEVVRIGGRIPTAYRYREDTKAALLESIRQALKVKPDISDSRRIVKGKVGSTTSTFRPAAGNTDPIDGTLSRTGVNQTFGNICTGNGTGADATTSPGTASALVSTSTSNQFSDLYRSIFLFDTSAIPAANTVSAATLTLTGDVKANNLGSNGIVIVGSAPAANNALASGDFQTMSKTAFCSAVAYAALATGAGTTDFNFNASGIAAIAKDTGARTKLGSMSDWDQSGTFGGVWGSVLFNYWDVYHADAAGTTQDPLLTVTHAAAGDTQEWLSPFTRFQKANNFSHVSY
jgi:hypothetical protein